VGLHFTLGLPEEEILNRVGKSEKVALVALYARAMRKRSCPERLMDEKIQAFSKKGVSKRDLVRELARLVTETYSSR